MSLCNALRRYATHKWERPMYRVIQIATGSLGKHALKQIIQDPRMELAGVWVHSKEKVGKDAGDLCGLGPTGIRATDQMDRIIATPADCAVFMLPDHHMSDPTEPGSHGAMLIDMMCALLRSGK